MIKFRASLSYYNPQKNIHPPSPVHKHRIGNLRIVPCKQIFWTSNFYSRHTNSLFSCNDVEYLIGKPWSTKMVLVKKVAALLKYGILSQINPTFIVFTYWKYDYFCSRVYNFWGDKLRFNCNFYTSWCNAIQCLHSKIFQQNFFHISRLLCTEELRFSVCYYVQLRRWIWHPY